MFSAPNRLCSETRGTVVRTNGQRRAVPGYMVCVTVACVRADVAARTLKYVTMTCKDNRSADEIEYR